MADLASHHTTSPDGSNGTLTAAPTDAPAGDDDLLGELARAMHQAATTQAERMHAELERRRTEQLEAIADRSRSEVDRLKAGSETDIAAIDAWAKAETEKIKLERLRRIDDRRERLAGQLERHGTISEREVFAIEVAIDAHRGEIDEFFGRLEHETDPATIARIAATLPAFPSLDEVAADARRTTEAEFVDLATTPDEPAVPPEPAAPAAAVAPVAPEAPAIVADDSAAISEARLLAVMDPDASRPAAETRQDWEAPHVVSVAAGSSQAEPVIEPPAEAPAHSRGSTLLRTVRAIRPMSGEHHDRGATDR
jgi:hypothetical protein